MPRHENDRDLAAGQENAANSRSRRTMAPDDERGTEAKKKSSMCLRMGSDLLAAIFHLARRVEFSGSTSGIPHLTQPGLFTYAVPSISSLLSGPPSSVKPCFSNSALRVS